jgi:hypothetical protein
MIAVRVGVPSRRKGAIVRWTSATGVGVQFQLMGVRETSAIIELQRESAPQSSSSLRQALGPTPEEAEELGIDVTI